MPSECDGRHTGPLDAAEHDGGVGPNVINVLEDRSSARFLGGGSGGGGGGGPALTEIVRLLYQFILGTVA